MEYNRFGVIVKVNNIDICRSFYRDVLKLGEPILDSTFRVVFKRGNALLILDCCKAKYLEHSSSSVNLLLGCDDVDAVRNSLSENGYNPVPYETPNPQMLFYSCSDPENNLIHFYGSNENI